MGNQRLKREELWNKIDANTKGMWNPHVRCLNINDDFYHIPTSVELEAFLTELKPTLPEGSGEGEAWDCDQYSRYLMVEATKYTSNAGISDKWPVGLASGFFKWMENGSLAHTCNCVLVSEGAFYWIEPQTCELKPKEKCMPASLRLMLV